MGYVGEGGALMAVRGRGLFCATDSISHMSYPSGLPVSLPY
ncbi:hypothetical protein PA08_2768 [Cutibacterium modestum P08]|nr:hypothetical protein PA08_2768 [Cutibacterium modestum P08]